MPVKTIADSLDRCGSATFATSINGTLAGIVHCIKIAAVDHLGRHPVGSGALGYAAVWFWVARKLGVAIVLVHKNHGELQYHRQI